MFKHVHVDSHALRLLACSLLLIVMMAVMGSVLLTNAAVEVERYDCLPTGDDYIDPTNVVYERLTDGYYRFHSVKPFRVKGSTTYTYYIDGNNYYLNMRNMELMLYNYDKSDSASITPTFNRYATSAGINGFTFETSEDTYYLSYSFEVDATDFEAGDKDNNLALFEGAYDTSLLDTFTNSLYEGANKDNFTQIANNAEVYYYTNYDNLVTVSKIQASLKAEDDVDGDISSNIKVVEDEYSSSDKKPGTYQILFQATDNNKNMAAVIVDVVVQDTTKPVFNGQLSYTVSLSSGLTEDTVRAGLTATDNVDGDITSSIAVVDDGLTGHESATGSYSITYKVVDSSNNEQTCTVSVNLVDLDNPVITGPTTVRQSNTANNTAQYYKAQMKATDNGEDFTSHIVIYKDNYTSHIGQIGSWEIVFRATDEAGNIGELTLTIEIVDQVAPVFFIDNTVIKLSAQSNNAKVEELVKMACEEQGQDYTMAEIMSDTYTGHEQESGSYEVRVACGNQMINVTVDVVDGLDAILAAKPRFLVQGANIFKALWISIKSLLKLK